MSSALGIITNELTLIRKIMYVREKVSNFRLGIYTGSVIRCVYSIFNKVETFFSKVHEFPCESTGRKVYVRLRFATRIECLLILFLTKLLSS